MAEILLGFAGVLVQVLFRYVPKVSDWYLAQENKGPLMLGFVAIAALLYFGAACLPYDLGIQVACSADGAVELVKAFVAILVGNQLTYLVGPKPAQG